MSYYCSGTFYPPIKYKAMNMCACETPGSNSFGPDTTMVRTRPCAADPCYGDLSCQYASRELPKWGLPSFIPGLIRAEPPYGTACKAPWTDSYYTFVKHGYPWTVYNKYIQETGTPKFPPKIKGKPFMPRAINRPGIASQPKGKLSSILRKFGLMKPLTPNVPLSMPNTPNVPLSMPNTPNVPLSMPNTPNVPLSMPNTPKTPFNAGSGTGVKVPVGGGRTGGGTLVRDPLGINPLPGSRGSRGGTGVKVPVGGGRTGGGTLVRDPLGIEPLINKGGTRISAPGRISSELQINYAPSPNLPGTSPALNRVVANATPLPLSNKAVKAAVQSSLNGYYSLGEEPEVIDKIPVCESPGILGKILGSGSQGITKQVGGALVLGALIGYYYGNR